MSDNYSYLDQNSEELSAKGNYRFETNAQLCWFKSYDKIETPPEDYVPDKIGGIDLGKARKRENEIRKNNNN